MEKTAVILFAHGSRDPEWAAPIRRVCDAVRALAPGMRAEPAFLEFLAPDLSACVDALVADGVSRIVVLPMFIAQGGHLRRDVPVMLEALRARHPKVDIVLEVAVGEVDSVVRAMAAHAVAIAS